MMKNAWFSLILISLMTSCATSYKYLPTPKQIPTSVKGSYISLTDYSRHTVNGELIAVKGDSLWVLTDSVVIINKRRVRKAFLKISFSTNNRAATEINAVLMPLTTIYNGYCIVVTLPISIITSSIVFFDANGSTYSFKYPGGGITWKDLSKFARFPQGIPPDIPTHKIK